MPAAFTNDLRRSPSSLLAPEPDTIAWFAVRLGAKLQTSWRSRLSSNEARRYPRQHTSWIDHEPSTLMLLRASQLTIEWLRDGLSQRHQVGLCHVPGEEDHLTSRAQGDDGYVVDPARRRNVRGWLSRKGRLNTSFGRGRQQRQAHSAIPDSH